MGIYIFEPSGAGGTPTLQQVLTAGNILNAVPNSININSGTFTIYNGSLFLGGSSDIVTCGDSNKTGYLTIDNNSTGGSFNIVGCYQEDPLIPGNFFRNYFLINPDTNLFYIGDYAEGNLKGWISVNGADNYFNADRFEISEITSNNGVISLKGTGYIFTGTPGPPADHLIIEINGTTYYIQLLS